MANVSLSMDVARSPFNRLPVEKRYAYQMKSVQWLQKVGCLKNLAINLWFFTSWTFFCFSAPLRANPLATSAPEDSLAGVTSAMAKNFKYCSLIS